VEVEEFLEVRPVFRKENTGEGGGGMIGPRSNQNGERGWGVVSGGGERLRGGEKRRDRSLYYLPLPKKKMK